MSGWLRTSICFLAILCCQCQASGSVRASSHPTGAIDQPLLVVSGDFDGDGHLDKVQGFPQASAGAGRVDVFWGSPSFKVAWPTILSAIKDPTTQLTRGRLGESLAVGDFNGDGLDDLAIGAPHTNFGIFTHSGSVVVIYGCQAASCGAVDSNGAGLPAVGSSLDPASSAGAQKITAMPHVQFGRFGKSLAAGDFNYDGYADLAIGAPGDTVNTRTEAGSVTIVYGSAVGLELTTRQSIHQNLLPVGASPAETDDHFGAALSAAKLDLDGDDDLVVGVPDEDYGVELDPGEVDVFWGGATGLNASSYVRFRHTSAMAGASISGDRLGHDLRAYNHIFFLSGSLHFGLAEAANCVSNKGFLSVAAGGIGTANLATVLNCNMDICDPESTRGDGALPEIPVNFIVIGNAATVPTNTDNLLPTANRIGTDPITGGAIAGMGYFESMIDLLNQQLRADDGNPICDGFDCLRLVYRNHTYYSPSMFRNVCPKLEALSNPSANPLVTLGESPLAFTQNCADEDTNICPIKTGSTRYDNLSAFAEAALDECDSLVDQAALNIVIYDVCKRVAGTDGDILECVGARDGRARPNENQPYAYVDYSRALRPRTPAIAAPEPAAAEEHEAGHAFGLEHACEPEDHGDNTHVMQTGSDHCPDGQGDRNLGFATQGRTDVIPNFVVEVEAMIETAREHVREWQCP